MGTSRVSTVPEGWFAKTKATAQGVPVTDQMIEAHVRETIIEKLSESLNLEAEIIDVDVSFADYGLDSILGVNLVQNINQTLAIALETTDLFDYSTVNQMTAFIVSGYKDIISVASGSNGQIDLSNDPPRMQNEKERMYSDVHRIHGGRIPAESAPEEKVNSAEAAVHQDSIAIVGMSGRFAKSRSVNELWQHLAKGDDLVEPVARWDLARYHSEKDYCNSGSFLDDIDQFDPVFFNISGVEAAYMDPQQRIFLEESWKALEDSGYAGTGTEDRLCGVYVGYNILDYQQLIGDNPPPQAMWGNAGSMIPARVAYYLNLRGPAVAVDTACSSSLVAVHLACQGLWAGETDMALAGGVFIQCTPGFYIAANRAGMLSPSGRCHAFDKRADGFVPGEGAGVVVLKRLKEAVADGDHIYGVIRGSGINQDGTTNGITAPSANSQEGLVRRVYDAFQIDPEQIRMVEAHGTGTSLGDPIEYQALTRAFRNYTAKNEYCAIGTIKTNIGHTAAAAGIAGLIKILLSLRHRQIPPSLHFQAGNPEIQFEGSPFYVNTRLLDWDCNPDSRRLAAISAFGFSGTNAHMVIEEAPKAEGRHRQKPGYLIALSARTFEQLQQQARQLAEYCEHEPHMDCGNLSHMLLLGRKHFNHRLACVVRNGNELATLLKKWLKKNKVLQIYVSELNETAHREHAALKRYGDQCLRNCSETNNDGEYLEHLSAVAELYIQGYALDFKRLFSNDPYSRISLPTYPFARERYWVPEPGSDADGASIISSESFAAPSSQEPFELMTFAEELREQALPDAASARIKTLICFISSPESRQLVLNTIQSLDRQTKIIFIAPDTAEQDKSSRYHYYVDRNDSRAYEQALLRIRKEHGEVDAILYLWALEDPDFIRDSTIIVHILQAMATAELKVGRFLLAAEFLDGLERCFLESWIGFERSLGIVLPNTQMTVVYQAAAEIEQNKNIEAWIQRCWAEIKAEKAETAFYQGGRRYVHKVRPTALQPGNTLIKPGGTYLVTGGCGGLGFLFAEFLAEKYHANLMLTGRSVMNREKELKIKALEDMGSQVVYIQGDVSDFDRMNTGIRQAKKHLKAIHGVIHAAGVQEKQSIFENDMESFQRVLDPKIKGTLVLDELLQSEPLDFVCYFSSSAAVLGDMGACDYAVGNRFLMAYAHYRNEEMRKGLKPGRAIAINWPLWRRGGMRMSDDQAEMHLKTSGQRFLESQEGLNIFDRILAQNGEQYLVLAGQPGRVKRFLGVGQGAAPSALSVSSTCAARSGEMKAVGLEQCLESDLKRNIGKVLNISQDKLDTKANLADFGFDSISLTHFAKVLSAHYGIEVTPAVFFGHSTVENLIQYFIKEYPERMLGFYQKEPEEPAAPQNVQAVEPATRQRIERSGFAVSNAMSSVPEPIAVIGMSGRFPNARNVEEMWHILEKGESVIQDFPDQRFPDQRAVKHEYKCGYIPGVSQFDPLFFEISPREAMSMDPRQRLLLQESWNALEDAGYGAARIKTGKIGVFVGAEEGEYGKLIKKKGSITSCHTAMLAARLAYFLNLNGPVMTFNTTCSSGLVAAHQACLSLRNHECDTAVAAGVSLLLTSEIFDGMQHAGMLSEDGKCFTFDKRANGMVPGEAVVALVLKRLSKAESDGDPIYAIIKGSGINYDGKTNGITAPSGVSQTRLLKSVYEQYKINPQDIEYIVAHGTATKLGDSVEVNALDDAFKEYSKNKGYCALTSTKTNFGHTLAASGLVSLVCLIQAFKHELIPASLNCEEENEYIKWGESPFYVNKKGRHWSENNEKGRIGAVSAFGMSGTNVHMVLQNYRSEKDDDTERFVPYCIFPFSGKTKTALQGRIDDMLAEFQSGKWTEKDLVRISHTLFEGRQHFDHRCAIVIQNLADAAHLLKQAGSAEKIPNLFQGKVPRNFTGQTAMRQYGNELLKKSQSMEKDGNRFKEALDALADLYCQGYELSWNLLFAGSSSQRVHLPSYPFARDHYWVTDLDPESPGEKEAACDPQASDQPLKLKTATGLARRPHISTARPEKPKSIVLRKLSKEQVEEVPCGSGGGTDPEAATCSQAAASSDGLQEELAASLADILYMKRSDVDAESNFLDMGLDSILGVEWVKVLNKQYGTSIKATKLYDYPNIRELTVFIQKEMGQGAKRPPGPAVIPVETDRIKLKPLTDNQALVDEAAEQISSVSSGGPEVSENDRTCPLAESLQAELTASLADVLYMNSGDVDADNQFIDMGMDSIIGVEWMKEINKRYGTTIPATKIYDYPTIREFAGFLRKVLNELAGVPSAKDSIPSCLPTENKSEMPVTKKIEDKTSCSNVECVDAIESSVNTLLPAGLKPEVLGNPLFQKRYGCKWSYFAGSMYRGISSEKFVITMSKARLLSFYGSAGFSAEELEPRIQRLQSGLSADAPYGMCLFADLNDPEAEMRLAGLYVKYRVPVIEAAAYSDLTLSLAYCRLKGIYQKAGRIVRPRRIIAKCSRLEVARRFLSPPPMDMVNELLASGAINEEEAELSQHIPMADDLAVEADSGGHTDQGVAFSLIPAVISLKEEKMKQYQCREPIMIGCGGGIGTPEAAASAFMLGADFIFTGSINQCTVESGAADAVKEILNRVSLHDTTVTIAGDMFEIGAKAQVVKKYTRFSTRANRLYQLFKQYNSLDAIPGAVRHEIETQYFKRTFAQVWERVCEYKNKKNPDQIREAQENPRLKMILIFKWYFAHCNKVTLRGDETEKDNFLIYCGPALGSFNQWVRGTPYESWKNRHVDQIAELLMSSACETIKTRRFSGDVYPERESAVIDLPAYRNKAERKLQTPFDDGAAVAVIGMAGQFPKADSLTEFWENLADGKDCISEIPGSRWSLNAYYDPDPKAPGKTHCKWMGVLEDADKFDPLFFNISPAEAELMDPQQRLFLQNCWSCIENAGLSPAVLSGSRCGVFVGCGTNDYGKSVTSGSLNAQVLMGAATSILSARISYLLNLKGPCLAIETACSSSLVAIAEACNSLVLGTSDIALAGGVNVQPGPSMHLMTSKAGMLSKEGRCFTFDNRANGFVTGEGVGVILLKRLADAVSDRDIIHGVIRGWGVNQDGKTNGITAPSAVSQVQLEKEVYDRFHIDPATISLAEAHGTGTKLGDPIEVEALTEAFRGYTEKKNYCALGSVKSNIGHLLTAAGIAGVIKVLLSMQNKMLPPTVHFEKLNEHIELDNSPFYINDKLRKWESAAGVPRCACVSSFGFSGTNAHLVIEEYPYKKDAAETINLNSRDNPALFVLSAKSEERLKNYALKMKQWIETRKELNPADIAYTLQTGRDAMDCRLAFLADSRRTLLETLEGFAAGKTLPGLLTTQDKKCEGKNDKDAQASLQTLIKHKKLKQIAELWVDGTDIDWELLYEDIKPHRVDLPAYPFLRERYWLPESLVESSERTMTAAPDAPIHPLLHRNTSDFSAQRFSSLFTGEEFFIKNHVIKGQKVLPGVAYLEMVRVALEQAAGAVPECETGIRLENIAWYRPVVLNHHPVRVHIGLYPENDKKIAYEIFSDSEGVDPDTIVHSQGNATLCEIKESPTMNIEALKAECNQNLTADQCYEAFKAMGIEYGPDHKGIEALYIGAEKVLARIRIPDSIAHTLDLYVLHPSIMDSALQASIGLMQASGKDITNAGAMKALLPFALEQMEIFGRCTTVMWALIRLSDDGEASERIQKLDVDVCDEKGNVRVRIKGLTSRVLRDEADLIDSKASRGMLMIRPVWQERSVGKKPHAPAYARHLVVLCEPEGVSREIIESGMNGVDCLVIQSRHHNIDTRFRDCAARVFEEIKEILQTRPREDILVQILAATSGEQKVFAGLSGLLKTARLENPKIIGQLIEIEAWDDTEGILSKLEENCRSPLDQQILYLNGKRHIAGLKTMEGLQQNAKIPWTDRGVYLLTGGAGGLGMIFAREIAQKVHDVSLVLTGRSRPDAAIQTKLQELEKLGARVEYRQVDVTHERSVEVLIRHVKESYGGINGIIHCAGVIRDNFIIKKTVEEMQEVLAPKVTGLVNLDKASKDLNMEFFILFSSGAGVMGNVGQADYATANAFMDAYAGYRNGLAAVKERFGQTLSINWPLWQEGGMQTDEETEKVMRQTTGVTAMQTSTGIKALYNGLASKQDQVMVLEGETGRMLSALNGPEAGGEDAKPLEISVKNKTQTSIEQDMLREKATNYLKTLLSSVIKLPAHRIETDAPLEKYGIDSIMIMQLTNQLEKSFGVLSKTLFFEYRNIDELTGYFIESYRDQLIELLELEDKEPSSQRGQSHIATAPEPVKSDFAGRRSRRLTSQDVKYQPGNKNPDIAIIGISGRYPQAKNIREFWINLRDGKDCITEIPQERWDHNLYFDQDRNKFGKTYGKWGGFLEGVDRFDPLFFNISMREAEIIDPQERLFLECVYETIEDAGYTRDSLNLHRGPGAEGYVGVFVGVMYEEYQLYGAQEQIQGRPLVLAGDSSSIANRVSYFCNFHGPSMAVNTMCSSSLTTIHLACQSIHRGDCDIALAGGVNLSIHPNKYLALGQGKFLSSKGRCESFGEGGDGYVPGEGVGAVLLKPLSRAVADHDQIYGVIKASAINHGGKTNGYAVPNPNAQATVIRRAIDQAGIDPGAISYLEAHGTGTSLGDPIELAGLSKAFGRYRKNGQFCAIGSVKSNIGHCESAAGIAGVTKVLLQMKHGQLVPSLHSNVLNPNIDFNNSPFRVQQKLAEWKRPVIEMNGETKEYPRIAGISSFGAGGANAHIIIEEYIPREFEREVIKVSPRKPAIVLISAKNKERLKEQIRQLLAFIREQRVSDSSLADMAYTLQVGRETFEERVAVIASSVKELVNKLEGFAEGQGHIEDLYCGEVMGDKGTISVFAADEDMQTTIDAWIDKGKYAKLLELWVKGLQVDWKRLYGDAKPRRMSLPAYPFAGERYWMPKTETQSFSSHGASNAAIIAPIHPLLHQNSSDFTEQRYSSTFSGREFFLQDHVVKGRRVLPGVAYLEMARAGVERAVGEKDRARGVRLKNVVWTHPLYVGEHPVQVHIGLSQGENGAVGYKVYSGAGQIDSKTMVHSQGDVEFCAVGDLPNLDLKALLHECDRKVITGDRCYEAFKAMGLEYGPGHRGISKIHVGPGQVLAKLSLPSVVGATKAQFVMHPSLMDSALQASIGLIVNTGDLPSDDIIGSVKPMLPFGLQQLEVFRACTPEMWAVVRPNTDRLFKNNVQKIDIDLSDPHGNVCIRMQGIALRELAGDAGVPATGTLLLESRWREQDIAPDTADSDFVRHIVMLCGLGEAHSEVESRLSGIRCLNIESGRNGIAERFQSCAEQVLEDIQKIFNDKPNGNVFLQLVVPDRGEERLFSALGGILKTARLENPKFVGQLIEVGPDADSIEISEKIQANSRDPFQPQIRYRHGNRWVAGWKELEAAPEPVKIPWQDQGVYLITGGTGGLGMIFAREIADKTTAAILVLTGRSPLNTEKKAELKRIENLGARIEYRQVDVTREKEAAGLIRGMHRQFGKINGIIHSAGVIRDNFILKKTRQELQEVLAPKVTGLVNLDMASRDLDLDLFILFSSVAGEMGNIGQADYAAANAFMDAYARHRNTLAASGGCHGRTVSVNWPLWQEGGMHVDGPTERILKEKFGIVPLQTQAGMNALYRSLALNKERVMVLSGDIRRFMDGFLRPWNAPAAIKTASKAVPVQGRDLLGKKAHRLFKEMISSVSKVPVNRIKSDDPFVNYGIDSIMMTQMTDQLEKLFGSLPKTLFLEYPTIDALTGYFLESFHDQMVELTEGRENSVNRAADMSQPIKPDKKSVKRFRPASKTFDADENRGAAVLSYRELLEKADEMSEEEVDMSLTRLLEAEMSKLTEKEGPLSKADKVFQEEVGDYG